MYDIVIPDYVKIIAIIIFLFFLYSIFCKTYIKLVEDKSIKTEKPKKKRKHRLKYLRRIHLPYKGQAKIYKYDKTYSYINSAWDEVQKPKKSSGKK